MVFLAAYSGIEAFIGLVDKTKIRKNFAKGMAFCRYCYFNRLFVAIFLWGVSTAGGAGM